MTDREIVDRVLLHEGISFTDDPFDRGGCTKFGITRPTLQEWRGRPVSCVDIQALTEDEARQIYHSRYVKPFDGVDEAVKPQVVDIAVNCGVLRARGMLALAQMSDKPLNLALFMERMRHYHRLVKAQPDQAKYLNGWFNRSVSFLT